MKITRHGNLRVRKRAGLSKRAVAKSVAIALKRGVTYDQTTGSLRKYIDELRLRDGHEAGTDVRLYGTMAFIFKNDTLITAMPMPSKYHRLVSKLIRGG